MVLLGVALIVSPYNKNLTLILWQDGGGGGGKATKGIGVGFHLENLKKEAKDFFS